MIERMESVKSVEQLVERYPWWGAGHLVLVHSRGVEGVEPATRLVALMHPLAAVPMSDVDIAKLTHKSSDDLIDIFLHRGSKRIVAEDGDAEDMSATNFDENDDIVSEELAEIYLNQGLYDEAIATYRKLSLVNSKKSIYFAELIEEISKKKAK
jgi:hypothetical protein